MTRTLKHKKLPILGREEANLLMEIVSYKTNAIPYAKDDDLLYIYPNGIISPNLELESLDNSESPLHNVNMLVKNLSLYQAQMQVILDEMFHNDYRQFAEKRLKIQKHKKGVTPEENEPVLIKSDKLGSHGKWGVVQKLQSPQTWVIRVRGGDEIIKPVGQTIPLVPNCLLKKN